MKIRESSNGSAIAPAKSMTRASECWPRRHPTWIGSLPTSAAGTAFWANLRRTTSTSSRVKPVTAEPSSTPSDPARRQVHSRRPLVAMALAACPVVHLLNSLPVTVMISVLATFTIVNEGGADR